MSLERLDKLLTEMNIGSRSEVKSYIKKGLVAVNGNIEKKPETKVETDSCRIEYKGQLLSYSKFRYYMLNKPSGFVSATQDNIDKTVIDLLKGENIKDLFPVGRLDKDTEGLLLITNDGELAHRLLAPSHHVDKTYFIRADGIVSSTDIEKLEKGLDIGEKSLTLPAVAQILKIDETSCKTELYLTIHEGKFHQVKRMMEAVGKPVLYLKRISMGTLNLDEALSSGEFRMLTDEEIAGLKKN